VLFRSLELLLVAGVGLMVLKMVRSGSSDASSSGAAALLSGRRAADLMEPDANGDTMLPALEGDPALPAPPSLANPSHMAALDQEIALAQVEGGIKASSLKRIGETIASNPAESASVIRQWMNA
jgi:flagellar M-ring protein FliF